MSVKASIEFDGFKQLAYAIDKAGKDLKQATDEALTDTQQLIEENLNTAAAVYKYKGLKGYATGAMYNAILRKADVKWIGDVAEVGTGFTSNGGATLSGYMHSIFVMYGTPRMSKNQKVFDAIKGNKTKNDVAKTQREALQKYMQLKGE